MAQSNSNSTIEPFRKSNSFGDWIERLVFFFNMNKVPDDEKRDHFVTISGPVILGNSNSCIPIAIYLKPIVQKWLKN